MTLEESVKEACSGLTSVRANERKKSAETLKDFLTRNAVPSLLSNNTLENSGYTWNHVFDAINDYIMKETEKCETAKTFHTVTLPLCTSLLHLCVAGANKGGAYIRSERITSACINILNDSRLTKAIGDAYLQLLYKHVLPNENYLGYISSGVWESLLDVCISACLTASSSLDDLVKIRLLWSVIRNACGHCQFATYLQDSLSKLKKCFVKVINDKKVQEYVLEIIIVLMETLSVEYHLTMCEFSENILPIIFKFYEMTITPKKKILLFKLFKITILIHHPLGRNRIVPGSLESNWKKLLYNILEIVTMENNQVQKLKKANENSSPECQDYYFVAAATFYQIFNVTEDTAGMEPGSSAKKQKISFNNKNSFSDLLEELRTNCNPWVGIILMYVKNYASSIMCKEYLLLLTVIEIVVTINDTIVSWDCLEELTCLTVKNVVTFKEYKNDSAIFISFWNACIRNATIANTSHKAIHNIMKVILNNVPLKHKDIQPLLASYVEKGMPVNNHSLETLNILYYKYYRKFCYLDVRKLCFAWLTQGNILFSLDAEVVNEFLLRLLCNENFPTTNYYNIDSKCTDVYNTLFFSIEKSILYTQFEHEVKNCSEVKRSKILETLEINDEMYIMVLNYLEQNLSNMLRLLHKSDKHVDFVKQVSLIVSFLDSMLKCNLKTCDEVKAMSLYAACQVSLRHVFVYLTQILKDDLPIHNKVILLKLVQNIFLEDFDDLLKIEVRKYIEEEFFHSVHNVIKRDIVLEDGDSSDYEIEFSNIGLKQNCVYLLAAYCRRQSDYAEEIVNCVLDRDLYNFSLNVEIECALRCIAIFNNGAVEQRYLDAIFCLMQDMCRVSFRNPKATRGILKTMLQLLSSIWSHEENITKQNCLIMIKSYLQRCSSMPPDVAALVYECIAKVLQLNQGEDADLHNTFKEILTENVKGNNHCIRLYCCHLLTTICKDFCEDDIERLTNHLSNIFVINVSNKKQTVLKDESMNRVSTVLHCFYALGITKTSFIHNLILKLLVFESEKSMDKQIVKKVLNMLTEKVTCNKIEVYMNNNLLRILNYWFITNKSFETLPLYLFGFDTLDDFVHKHVKWLVPTDVLWRHNGVVANSKVLQRFVIQAKKSVEDIIEICFCNIISLCLPHVVLVKYKMENEKHNFKTTESANRLFQSTRDILKNEKWSNLFVENLGEILLLTATHVCDITEAAELFGSLPLQDYSSTYTYSKRVFSSILKYFGELIDENIMQYLCNNQPLIILNILFKLWDNVLLEKVFDFKALFMHAYLSFVDNVPLGHASDATLCNYACASISYAVKNSQSNEEVQIYVEGLNMVISKIIKHSPKSIEIIQTSTLSKIVSTINNKIKEGYDIKCKSLLKYHVKEFKHDINESVDVIDCINLNTANKVEKKVLKLQFSEKLKANILNLPSASPSTLLEMCRFLKKNKSFIKELYTDFNTKGFSEDCKISLIHQVVFILTNLIKTNSDEEIAMEACNCLAEIGSYDLKTLVTVPPADTKKITDLNPKQYFAVIALECLSEHIFDEDPTVSKKVIKVLNSILKFRDGQCALDIVDIDKGIIQTLAPVDCEIFAEYKIDSCKFGKYDSVAYWIPSSVENHSQWVTRITLALLDLITSNANYLNSFVAVCSVKPTFCQKIMPALMGLILSSSSDSHIKVFREQIRQVFKCIWDKSYRVSFETSDVSNSSKESSKLNNDDKMIVEYMLNIVNFVRIQSTSYKTQPRGQPPASLNYLQLEYDRVSWAAAAADQHWAALYYGELSIVGEESGAHLVPDIFRKCFVAIGEMDAIDGCGIAHLTSEHEKRKHLINSGQFADALLLHDIALSRGIADACVVYGAVTSLHKSGMHHLALQYIRSYPENDDLDDIKYECLSYLGDWSDFVDTSELAAKSDAGVYKQNTIIKAMRYACLKDCLNIQPTVKAGIKLDKSLNRAKLATAKLCQNINMENSQNVYRLVAYLHLFRDIESYFSVRCNKNSISNLIEEWKVYNLPSFNDFKHLEPLISQRSLILEQIAKTDSIYLSDIHNLQLQYADIGLRNNRIQMAQRIVAAVKSDQTSKNVVLLESQISWAKGHKDIALSLLRSIVAQQSDDTRLTAMSLRQYGLWMSECKRETSSDIQKYLQKSLEALNSKDDADTRLKVYYDIAKFADDEYKQVVMYMKSSVFENKVKCVESLKGTAKSLKTSQQAATKNEEKVAINIKYRVNTAFGVLDDAEIANTRTEKECFLNLAMRYYLLSLKNSDDNDLSVFRVISLWLDNPCFEFEDGNFGNDLQEVPTWKFITVLPQLAPRLSDDNSAFAELLRKIMMRCAIEHPHHTLPLLFSLKNSDKGETTSADTATGGEPRVLAAAALVQRVGQHNDRLARIVAQMEDICDATISFAYCVPESKDFKPQVVPRREAISRLQDLNAIPIPTDTLAVRKACDYSSINTLSSFEKYFELVGGVNFPKKISCLSSDGKKRILLIKGKDDMRQDAVMQQVFTIVNTLLEKNSTTNRNKLLIRTYKVVPMSRRSGVLQWCEGTMPIGTYLVTAHTKYRPQDIAPLAARHKLKFCQENKKSNKYKLEVFKEILKVFKPVFHNFFTEHYLDPVTWYERRLAYTRSVATSSMVGYILGIGDRHVQNILIDKTTAEVIHIDFGIAFDQGKTLQTPETVPFRLTQDFIAGFGSSGIEGIFRRCCEKTLQLLRDNQETLLTILEVLLCDPLYLWIVSNTPTTKSSRKNALNEESGGAGCVGSPGGAVGGLAARALLTVNSKLCGAEGSAGGVSVEGHVAKLLRSATDPANLCQLFHGWQAYL